jgi:hypothetical protein
MTTIIMMMGRQTGRGGVENRHAQEWEIRKDTYSSDLWGY